MSEFCRVMRFSMDMRKVNQAQLAQRMGCAKSMVHYWYNDEHQATISVAQKMAAALNRDVTLFYTALEDDMKKALGKDVSISEMLTMRAEGLTNKQIAERLDVHVATVYKYIGKRSMDVRKAQEQHKACPVGGNITGYSKAEKAEDVIEQIHKEQAGDHVVTVGVYDEPEVKVVEEVNPVVETVSPDVHVSDVPAIPMFKTLRKRIVTRLQGSNCVYGIDTDASYVELSDENGGQLAGIIDYEMIPTLIAELNEIYRMRGDA